MENPTSPLRPRPGSREERDARDSSRRRDARAAARDVTIPPVANPARRERCRLDLGLFCKRYFPRVFSLPWSAAHRAIIADLEDVILRGARLTDVQPRGDGKSSLAHAAILWAVLYGHRRFPVVITDTWRNAIARLKGLRTALETNDDLLADFPEVCAPIRALGRVYNRASAQTVNGKPTHLSMGGGDDNVLVFPTVEGSPSAGSALAISTMESAIRGLVHATADGEMLRPDVVILDDPQDRATAINPAQVDKREALILGDILGLAGPDASLACLYLGTVVCLGDLTDRFADRDRHPDWRGRRFRLVIAPPDNTALWERYWDVREKCHKSLGHDRLASAFYLVHRREMDRGAVVGWEARYDTEREYSALQHAMNLRQDVGEDAFLAEYQNEPPEAVDKPLLVLDAYTVEKADSGLVRGQIPPDALVLVSGWDVGKYNVYWTAIAVAAQRVASIVDYGAEPVDAPGGPVDPHDPTARQAMRLAILGALRRLRDKFVEDPYLDSSGARRPLDLCLCDARWETQSVRDFATESGPVFQAVMGHGTSRNQRAWRVPKAATIAPTGDIYYLQERGEVTWHVYTDSYKQQVHEGFLLNATAPGSLRLFPGEQRHAHHSFARHVTAEVQRQKLPGVIVWEAARGRADNHYLDALCYALACVSLLELDAPDLNLGGRAASPVSAGRGPREDTPSDRANRPADWMGGGRDSWL